MRKLKCTKNSVIPLALVAVHGIKNNNNKIKNKFFISTLCFRNLKFSI